MQSSRFPYSGLGLIVLALLGVFWLTAPADAEEDFVNHACPNPAVNKKFRPKDDALDLFLEAATKYFDLEEDLYVGRLAFLDALHKELAKGKAHEGYDLLQDMAFLREVIYQSRYFYPQWANKKYRAEQGVENYKSKRLWHHLRSDEVALAYSMPKAYPKKNKVFLKLPRPAPVPLLISTITKSDYTGQEFPGFALLERRFNKTASKAVLDDWGVLVPITPAGNYISTAPNGQKVVRGVIDQAVRFFESYNVDFDRIVADGGPESRLMAMNSPYMFAGFVFRTREKFTEEELALVKNFAPVPVYVIRCPITTKALKGAGHPDVTMGDEAGLHAWLKDRQRVIPTKFSYNIAGPQHQFAYWINLEQVNWAAPVRQIDVEVVDTEDDPNTIKITAQGVSQMSLFLNDDIVNLSKPVRVIINGHLEFEDKIERSLDVAFNRDPLKIRESLYFGLVFPARVMRLGVRPAKKAEPEEGTDDVATGSGDPAKEAKAQKLLDKAKDYVKAKNTAGAIKRLEAVLDKYGDTAVAAEAKELLEKLK